MGEIADTLRSTLRQLAQADARLYRGLVEELGDGATAVEEPRALIQPEGGAPATEAQLLALKRWQAIREDERSGFTPHCPDVVAELASPSDEGPRGLTSLRRKMAAD